MDLSESARVVHERIMNLDPEYAFQTIDYLFRNGHTDKDMIRFAFSPDTVILTLIHKAKLHNYNSGSNFLFHPNQCSPAMAPYANNMEFVQPMPMMYTDSGVDDFRRRSGLQYLSMEEQANSHSPGNSRFYYANAPPQPTMHSPPPPPQPTMHRIRTNRRSTSLPEFPVKVCHYFLKGYCKHGDNCRYFHGFPENCAQNFYDEVPNDDHPLSPMSLEKLELEITELLKSRCGHPISIASLPMMYQDKFGKTLQAEGYLTESQRHGKSGYNLTKLLARLKGSIRLIDRPHGQHSVILLEDYPRYLETNNERNEHGSIVARSRQIYLTFPAESTFTEQDVSAYFNSKFGPVQDVRIPCQEERMFGFVTFVFPETVKQILTKGNPHFVCGARVLVKPYRERLRPIIVDRKSTEKNQQNQNTVYYPAHYIEPEPTLNSVSRAFDNSRFLKEQQMMEEQRELELEMHRLQLGPKAVNHYHHPHPQHLYNDYSMLNNNDFNLSEVAFQSAGERFNYLLDVLYTASNCGEDEASGQGGDHVELPDSPFACPIWSGGGGVSVI